MVRNPDAVIRKAIEKHFKFRGQACICLTKEKYDKAWNAVLFDISKYGYHSDFLKLYEKQIQSKVAPIDWSFVEEPMPPKRPPKTLNIRTAHRIHRRKTGYEKMRLDGTEKLKWKKIR